MSSLVIMLMKNIISVGIFQVRQLHSVNRCKGDGNNNSFFNNIFLQNMKLDHVKLELNCRAKLGL